MGIDDQKQTKMGLEKTGCMLKSLNRCIKTLHMLATFYKGLLGRELESGAYS